MSFVTQGIWVNLCLRKLLLGFKLWTTLIGLLSTACQSPLKGWGVTSAKLKHRMHLVYYFITPSPPSSFPSDRLSFPSFPKLWLLELEQPAKQEKNFIDAYSPHQMTFSLWIIIIDIIISSALPPRWYIICNFHLAVFVRFMEQISLWNFMRR